MSRDMRSRPSLAPRTHSNGERSPTSLPSSMATMGSNDLTERSLDSDSNGLLPSAGTPATSWFPANAGDPAGRKGERRVADRVPRGPARDAAPLALVP